MDGELTVAVDSDVTKTNKNIGNKINKQSITTEKTATKATRAVSNFIGQNLQLDSAVLKTHKKCLARVEASSYCSVGQE